MLASFARPAPLLACVALSFLAACGSDDVTSKPPSAEPQHPLWSDDALDPHNPLPDDRLLSGNKVAMRPDYYLPFVPVSSVNETAVTTYERNAQWLSTQEGWGTFASSLIPFSGPIDEASMVDRFAIVRLDPPGPGVPVHAIAHAHSNFVEVQPVAPMEPGARYATVVRSGVTSGGHAVTANAAYQSAMRGSAEEEAAATALGVAASELLLVVPFTTARVHDDLASAAAQLVDVEPAIDFTAVPDNERWPRGVYDKEAFLAFFDGDPGLKNELSGGLANAGTIAIGTFSSRDYRNADGVFDPDVIAGTKEPARADVEFLFITPDPALHPPPWKTTIIQHGLGGTAKDVLVRAAAFHAQGIAVIGIDALDHGIRGNVFDFFHIDDMRRARENFRQTCLDQIQLCRIAAAQLIDVDGTPGPDLDGSCSYFGQSLGGILGGLYSAVAPDGPVAVLNVAGGGLTRIMQSEVIGARIGLLLAPSVGMSLNDDDYPRVLPFFAWFGQTIMDPADPINYGRLVFATPPAHASAPRRVLVQGGVDDGYIPNSTTEALVAAMGIATLDAAASDPAGVDGLWWIDLADFGIENDISEGNDPHNIMSLIEGVRVQAATYVKSEGAEIVDPGHLPE